MTTKVSPTSTVQVIDKTVKVLDCFSPERPALSLTEIRRLTGFPATTVNRLVNTMLANDVLQAEGTMYRIGLRAMAWSAAAAAGSDLITAAKPVLCDIRDRSGETSGLYVRRGSTRVLVAAELSSRSIVYRPHMGQVMPMHAGAGGLVFLAFDERALGATLDSEDPAVQAAVANRARLGERLQQIREAGYAFTQEEREPGLNSVAAPVFDGTDRLVAVLAVGAPSIRLDSETAAVVGPSVAGSARTLARRLGWLNRETPDRHAAVDIAAQRLA